MCSARWKGGAESSSFMMMATGCGAFPTRRSLPRPAASPRGWRPPGSSAATRFCSGARTARSGWRATGARSSPASWSCRSTTGRRPPSPVRSRASSRPGSRWRAPRWNTRRRSLTPPAPRPWTSAPASRCGRSRTSTGKRTARCPRSPSPVTTSRRSCSPPAPRPSPKAWWCGTRTCSRTWCPLPPRSRSTSPTPVRSCRSVS